MRTAVIEDQPTGTHLQRLRDGFLRLGARLRRRLATRPNAIQTTVGAERLELRSPHAHWIVGRGLCMYRREDFSNVPRNRRRGAVELRLPVWSPFTNTGYHCVWSGGMAMVWFWDADKVRVGDELFGGPAAADAPVRIAPESVFHPTKPDGIHLQRCHDGFELQRWEAGILEDAFWFADGPMEDDVAWFLGRAPDGEAGSLQDIPVAPAAPLLADPWSSALRPREWLEVNEAPLVAGLFLMLAVALVWQETRIWKVHYIKEETVAEFERMQDILAPELAARTELLDLRRQNRALAAILGEPSQARLMAIVDTAIPSDEAVFESWRYQQGELRVVLEDPAPDPIAYVESFSEVPIFQDVQAAPARGADRLEIILQVAP